MICDITNFSGANSGPILSLDKCDVETLILQCTYTENGIFFIKGQNGEVVF